MYVQWYVNMHSPLHSIPPGTSPHSMDQSSQHDKSSYHTEGHTSPRGDKGSHVCIPYPTYPQDTLQRDTHIIYHKKANRYTKIEKL